MKPWYLRTHRYGQTNLTEDDPARNNLDFWKKHWERTGIEGVIVNCGGIVSYYESAYKFQYRAASMQEGQDYFKTWLDEARAAGLTVIARMDINRQTEDFYLEHPDWFCMDKEGKPYTAQGRYLTCVNSAYYKEFIPLVLTEIVNKYHPDGFADNSWKGMNRDHICYCENCKTRFRKDTGYELPEKEDWNSLVYRTWVRWNIDIRTENWRLFNETTKKAGGEDCMWCGMLNASPTEVKSFCDLKVLAEESKIIFTDHQGRDLLNGFEQNEENGQLLHMASSEDIIIPESFANYVRGERTFRLSADPYQETNTWMLSGTSGGISPWYHHIGGGTRDRRQFDTPVPFFNWHKAHEDVLYDRKTLANVAIVWSTDNAVFYGEDQVNERVELPYRGFASALHEAGIPFFPVNIRDILKYSDRIETLILPDIQVMSDQEISDILAFKALGKSVILSGNPGCRDSLGTKRETNPLLSALGLTDSGACTGSFTRESSDWEHPKAHSYLDITNRETVPEGILQGFENTDILGFGGGIIHMNASDDWKAYFGYVDPFPIYPPEFSWVRSVQEHLHWLYLSDTNGKTIYLGADIDRCAGRNRLPDHSALLKNLVLFTLENLPVQVDSYGYLNVSIYEKENARIVHLTNFSAANVIGYMHRTIPVYDSFVTVPAKGSKAYVEYLVSECKTEIQAVNGKYIVPVHEVKDFEVLKITEEE